jgi:hypothetical protein
MPPIHRKATDTSDSEAFSEQFPVAQFGILRFQTDWIHWAYKLLAFSVLALHLLLGWWLFSPWSLAWSSAQHDLVSVKNADPERCAWPYRTSEIYI